MTPSGPAIPEKPILFSGAMVRAILAGQKSQTRRTCSSARWWRHVDFVAGRGDSKDDPENWGYADEYGDYWTLKGQENGGSGELPCPYGRPGERLFWTMAAPSWVGQAAEQRFWARVHKTETCWEWLGNVSGHARHGRIKIGESTVSTHRYSWALHRGDPGRLQVLHRCDVGWCVRPDHLYLGTSEDNRRDQTERGRIRHLHGDCNPASRITQADVAEIKRLCAAGVKQDDIARRYGIGQPHVSKIANTRRREGLEVPPLPLLGSRWLAIESVRVQRLQDITEEDARAEGVRPEIAGVGEDGPIKTHRTAFVRLWESINGKRPGCSWADNPFVYAITFQVSGPAILSQGDGQKGTGK